MGFADRPSGCVRREGFPGHDGLAMTGCRRGGAIPRDHHGLGRLHIDADDFNPHLVLQADKDTHRPKGEAHRWSLIACRPAGS